MNTYYYQDHAMYLRLTAERAIHKTLNPTHFELSDLTVGDSF